MKPYATMRWRTQPLSANTAMVVVDGVDGDSEALSAPLPTIGCEMVVDLHNQSLRLLKSLQLNGG